MIDRQMINSTRNDMEQILMRARIIHLLMAAMLFGGCAVQLAPLYDKAVVDGMTVANRDAMVLFAEVSGGTAAASYQSRFGSYNRLIGSFDALALQAKARPMPEIPAKADQWLQKRGIPPVTDDEIPSAHALEKIASTLTKMRDTDAKQGLTAVEVQAFKGQVSIYMDQAVTYEAFLER